MSVGQVDETRYFGLPFPKHGTWKVSSRVLVVLFFIHTEKRDDCYNCSGVELYIQGLPLSCVYIARIQPEFSECLDRGPGKHGDFINNSVRNYCHIEGNASPSKW